MPERAGDFCSCNRAPSAGETHSLACVWRNRPTVDDFTVEQVEQAIEHARRIQRALHPDERPCGACEGEGCEVCGHEG